MTNSEKSEHQDSIRDHVLARIAEEHIVPKGRSYFMLRNALFWSLTVFAVAVGAASVAAIIFFELNVGWEYYEMTHGSALSFFIATLPGMWLFLIVVALILVAYNARRTKRGYRHSITALILIGLAGSITGGLLIYGSGLDDDLEREVDALVSLYMSADDLREDFWNQPTRGLHTGFIERIDLTTGDFEIRTPGGGIRLFHITRIPTDPPEQYEKGAHVRIIAIASSSIPGLIVCHIMPWEGKHARSLKDIGERKQHLLRTLRERFLGTDAPANSTDSDLCSALIREQAGRHMLRAPYAP